jgi:integrase
MGNSELVSLARIKIEVDLRKLTGIDNAGRELLLAMHLAGAKGIPMKVVQEIMRHSNFQITMDTYSHLLPSALNDAMQTMNDISSKPVFEPVVAPGKRETIQ